MKLGGVHLGNQEEVSMKNELEKSFKEFIEAIEQQRPVILNRNGEWEVKNSWLHYLKKIFGREGHSWLCLVENFVMLLDQLEKIPILFHSSAQGVHQKADFYHYLRAANAIESRLMTL